MELEEVIAFKYLVTKMSMEVEVNHSLHERARMVRGLIYLGRSRGLSINAKIGNLEGIIGSPALYGSKSRVGNVKESRKVLDMRCLKRAL